MEEEIHKMRVALAQAQAQLKDVSVRFSPTMFSNRADDGFGSERLKIQYCYPRNHIQCRLKPRAIYSFGCLKSHGHHVFLRMAFRLT
jgi:hypothetical protein